MRNSCLYNFIYKLSEIMDDLKHEIDAMSDNCYDNTHILSLQLFMAQLAKETV